jgi:hypothetical protein
MVSLLGDEHSKGGRCGLAKQNSTTCLLGQSTRKGVPIGQATESLLQSLSDLVDVQGLACLSQYPNG